MWVALFFQYHTQFFKFVSAFKHYILQKWISMTDVFKATTGVHRAPLHQGYKPCFIRAVPPQTYGNVCWWSLYHIGLWWLCPTDTRLKACEDELHGPPVVALTSGRYFITTQQKMDIKTDTANWDSSRFCIKMETYCFNSINDKGKSIITKI